MRRWPWMIAVRSGWIAAERGRNAIGVNGAKLASTRPSQVKMVSFIALSSIAHEASADPVHTVRPAGSVYSSARLRQLVRAPVCHDETDAPYERGRLVVTALGAGQFTFEVVHPA